MIIVSGDFTSVNVLIHRQATRLLARSINVQITVPKRRVVGANAIVVVSAEKFGGAEGDRTPDLMTASSS